MTVFVRGEEMKTYLFQAVRIVNSQILFILLIAFFEIRIFPLLNLVLSVMSLPLIVGLYGRFVQVVQGGDGDLRFFKNVRTHFRNYLIVAIAVGIFILIIREFAGRGFGEKYMVLVSTALITSLTVYIYPGVFIWKKDFEAIPLGAKILADNVKSSWPLVGLAFLSGLTPLLILPLFTFVSPYFEGRLLPVVISSYLVGLISFFISSVVFVTASLVLVQSPLIDRSQQ